MSPILLSVVGCNIINPAEDTPTYVNIDSFKMTITDPIKEGSNSRNINSVWVYYNNNPVGVFDLPCRVPVITEGNSGQILVAPGISLNGFQDLQQQYPFYLFDTMTLQSNPGGQVNFTPTTRYISSAKFPFKEDFEVGNSFTEFYPGVTGDTSIVKTSKASDVYEGGGSGYIYLDANNPTSENISGTGFSIGKGESYLEINYKCSVPFQVGLYSTATSGVDVYDENIGGVKASSVWKKIYISLATYTGTYPGTNYKVLIKSSLPDGYTDGYVLLDNIKVVCY